MFKKVLILSAAVGAGYLRAAEAIEKAFQREKTAFEIKNIDVLNYTNPLFRRTARSRQIEHAAFDRISQKLSARHRRCLSEKIK